MREIFVYKLTGVKTLLTGGIMGNDSTSNKKRTRNERDESDDEGKEEGPSTSRKPMKVLPVSIQQFNAPCLDADPKKKVYSHHKVRTSLRDRTLDSMFPVTNQSQQPEASSSTSEITPPLNTLSKQRDVIESKCFLTSVQNLRQQVAKGKHRRECPTSFVKLSSYNKYLELSEILVNHTFIGIVDIHRCLSLIQYSTKLYLVNHDALACVFSLSFILSKVSFN